MCKLCAAHLVADELHDLLQSAQLSEAGPALRVQHTVVHCPQAKLLDDCVLRGEELQHSLETCRGEG